MATTYLLSSAPFAELIAMPSSAIGIKYYDSARGYDSTGHFLHKKN
jgi:hypothetical protein